MIRFFEPFFAGFLIDVFFSRYVQRWAQRELARLIVLTRLVTFARRLTCGCTLTALMQAAPLSAQSFRFGLKESRKPIPLRLTRQSG
jgi:hypothetical protein